MNLAKELDTKSILRNQRNFNTTITIDQNQKSGKKYHFYNNKKNNVPRNKPKQGGKRPILRKL